MKLHSSLFARILFWFFMNLAVVATVLVAFFEFHSQVDLRTILGQQASDRMRIAGRLISHDLSQTPQSDWRNVIARHGEIYQVSFALVLDNGLKFSPPDLSIPDVVMKAVTDARPPMPHPGGFPPPPAGPHEDQENRNGRSIAGSAGLPGQDMERNEPRGHGGNRGIEPRLIMHTKNPTRYWTGIWVPVSLEQARPPVPAMLLAASDSITGNGLFFEPMAWMVVAAAMLLISILLWIPLVRSITRPLARMTRATEEIAKGKFDVRIDEARSDEIGRLGNAINHMTARLSGFVTGQKRFLGDVAHELGSPIARIQFGLGILERRVDPENRERVADVLEDVDHMSNLVNELLSFSRAEMNPGKVKLEPTELPAVVQRVVQRENNPAVKIITRIDPGTRVMAAPELLARALANVIRNAVRYAGKAGPIHVSAETKKDAVTIEIRDSGPGVPEDLVDRIFEPFFRPEPSRGRDSGGVGLGLAIVKTCVTACKGTVSARNLKPGGFAVTITLAPGCDQT